MERPSRRIKEQYFYSFWAKCAKSQYVWLVFAIKFLSYFVCVFFYSVLEIFLEDISYIV